MSNFYNVRRVAKTNISESQSKREFAGRRAAAGASFCCSAVSIAQAGPRRICLTGRGDRRRQVTVAAVS